MDDEVLDPKEIDETEDLDDFDEPHTEKHSKGKPKAKDDDLLSLSDLEDEEDETLAEDRFDDVEPEDLW